MITLAEIASNLRDLQLHIDHAIQQQQRASPTSQAQSAMPSLPSGERQLIELAELTNSNAAWMIGQVAAEWIRRHAKGRTDADLASMLGMSPDQVYQRRRVWETFADVRTAFPSLHWSHFFAALTWDDAANCLTWANDVGATVAEMRAWRRAQRGEDLGGISLDGE